MAINIEYGPVRGLLEAAAATGQGQYRQTAAARDQALLGDVMRYRLGQQQLEQQASQLQNAYRSVQQPRMQIAPQTQTRITRSPQVGQAPTQLPANFGTTGQQGEGSIQIAGRNYGFDATGGIIDLDTRKEARGNFVVPEQGGQQELHPFMQYAGQIAQGIKDPAKIAELGALTQMAVESGMTGNQFQNAIKELTQSAKPVLSPQFVANEQINAVDRDIRTIENQIRDLDKLMLDSGVDPNGPPSQLDPGTRSRSVLGRVTDFYGGRTGLTEGADLTGEGPAPEAAAAYRRKVALQNQLRQLSQQRNSILSTGTTPPSAQPAAEVPTATNPVTGERVQYINGEWVPIK